MLHLKDSYFSPIEKDINSFFFAHFFRPIMEAVGDDGLSVKLNAAESLILSAIKAGRIVYKDGTISGQFNARLSAELYRNGYSYSKRTGVFRGAVSPTIKAAAMLADSKRKALTDRLSRAIDDAEATIWKEIKNLTLGMSLPLPAMAEDIRRDLWKVGVMPEVSPYTERKLRNDYTDSQQFNVKNWSPEQVTRLREMVQKIQTTPDNASLKQIIENEWQVSASKARFLARQETSIFLSRFSMNRAAETGIARYRWSTSHDERVRDSHKHLQGKIIPFDDPPIVDFRTGRRAHAGEDYNCRCAKIWMLD